jgi:hypothetical protein
MDDRVERVGALDALGQDGGPGQQRLAALARAPRGVEEGLPHG